MREEGGYFLYFVGPIEQATVDDTLRRVRAELGEAAEAAITKGKWMPLNEAVALALSWPELRVSPCK